MGAFGKYWRRALLGINRSFSHTSGVHSQLAQLEQQILGLTRDLQNLDGRLEHIRADEARHGSELLRRIDGLDQASKENGTSRARDEARLSACEQRTEVLETGCSQVRDTVAELEASVSETARRFETRFGQIRFLQNSASEQLLAFKTELTETRSRLETRDNETNSRLEEEHLHYVSLERSLGEVQSRIDGSDREIDALHQEVVGQRLHIERFLDSATAQLEVANNRAALLEKRVQTDFELKEKQLQQLEVQLQHQNKRLVMVILAVTVILVLLVTLAILR